MGVFVVTKMNQREPWLMYEAGAISEAVGLEARKTRVMTDLFDMGEIDIERGSPLIPFQQSTADKPGTWSLVKSLNTCLRSLAPTPL